MRKLFIVLCLAACRGGWATDVCPKAAVVNPAFTKARDNLQQKLKEFANAPVVAEHADQTLSLLIKGKSPVITTWLKSHQLEDKGEEEIVRAWRDYYAQFFVLSKYPQSDAKMNEAVEKLVDGVVTTSLPQPFREQMDKLFQEAQRESLKRIESWPLAEGAKKAILARLRGVSLFWVTSLRKAGDRVIPLEFLEWGVAYDPAHNQINMGLNALAYVGDATIVSVFAHELGHSFDSCRWGAFFTGPWPFTQVGECLRKPESVGAKRRDDSQLAALVTKGRVSKEIAAGLKLNPTCNKLVYPPPDVQADELPESFADWFSAEVMANRAAPAQGLRQDLCENRMLTPGSSYPSNVDRLNKIYFSNATLRSKVAATSPLSIYCAFK